MAEAVWDDELTLELSRAVIEQVSPQELPVFEAIAAGYVQEGMTALPRSDGPLGFGVDVLPLSVVIIPVAQAVGQMLIAALGALTAEAALREVKDLLKKRFRKDSSPELAIPPKVVEDARAAALAQARAFGLADDQATLLANAVAGSFLPART